MSEEGRLTIGKLLVCLPNKPKALNHHLSPLNVLTNSDMEKCRILLEVVEQIKLFALIEL